MHFRHRQTADNGAIVLNFGMPAVVPDVITYTIFFCQSFWVLEFCHFEIWVSLLDWLIILTTV